MVDTRVDLCGITIDNPVIPASGTFGYGYEFAELYDINCLGTFSFKGTTLEPRFGNDTPRIAECPAGMLNSVGLQNPGVDDVIKEELPKLASVAANQEREIHNEREVYRCLGPGPVRTGSRGRERKESADINKNIYTVSLQGRGESPPPRVTAISPPQGLRKTRGTV